MTDNGSQNEADEIFGKRKPEKPVTKRELKDKAMKDPVIQLALKLFKGRIVDIWEEDNWTSR